MNTSKKPDYNSGWYEKNQTGLQQYLSDLKKWSKDGKIVADAFAAAKQLQSQQPEPIEEKDADYIKVELMWDLNNLYQPQCINTGFTTSAAIPESKFPLIKRAIERTINNQPEPIDNGWISVEDRLPDETTDFNEADNWVLCCTGLGAVLVSLCYYDHKDKNWYDSTNPFPETRITHWQPLPKSPIK